MILRGKALLQWFLDEVFPSCELRNLQVQVLVLNPADYRDLLSLPQVERQTQLGETLYSLWDAVLLEDAGVPVSHVRVVNAEESMLRIMGEDCTTMLSYQIADQKKKARQAVDELLSDPSTPRRTKVKLHTLRALTYVAQKVVRVALRGKRRPAWVDALLEVAIQEVVDKEHDVRNRDQDSERSDPGENNPGEHFEEDGGHTLPGRRRELGSLSAERHGNDADHEDEGSESQELGGDEESREDRHAALSTPPQCQKIFTRVMRKT